MNRNTFTGTLELVTPSKYDESLRLKIDNGWYGCWLKPLPKGVEAGASVEFTLNNSGKGIADIWLAGQNVANAQANPAMYQPNRPPAPSHDAPAPPAQSATHHGTKDQWIFVAGAVNHYIAAHPDMEAEALADVAMQAVKAARRVMWGFNTSDENLRRYLDGGTPAPKGVSKAAPPATPMDQEIEQADAIASDPMTTSPNDDIPF